MKSTRAQTLWRLAEFKIILGETDSFRRYFQNGRYLDVFRSDGSGKLISEMRHHCTVAMFEPDGRVISVFKFGSSGAALRFIARQIVPYWLSTPPLEVKKNAVAQSMLETAHCAAQRHF